MQAWLLRTTYAAGALLGASLMLAQPAEAASFRCSASASVNDAGPGSDTINAQPCQVAYENGGTTASALAAAGVLRGASQANAGGAAGFAGANSYAEMADGVIVSGLSDLGANLTFRIKVEGDLFGATSGGRTLGGDPTGASEFATFVKLSTSRGLSGQGGINGCATAPSSGISVCNGDFDYGPSESEVVDGFMTASVFVMNGDSLQIVMGLRTSALAHRPSMSQSGFARADFADTVYWDGVVFDDDSRNVQLTSAATGFDYRNSAFPDAAGGVPEPASWALMMVGFGLAGASLRRRQARAQPAGAPALG